MLPSMSVPVPMSMPMPAIMLSMPARRVLLELKVQLIVRGCCRLGWGRGVLLLMLVKIVALVVVCNVDLCGVGEVVLVGRRMDRQVISRVEQLIDDVLHDWSYRQLITDWRWASSLVAKYS